MDGLLFSCPPSAGPGSSSESISPPVLQPLRLLCCIGRGQRADSASTSPRPTVLSFMKSKIPKQVATGVSLVTPWSAPPALAASALRRRGRVGLRASSNGVSGLVCGVDGP